MVPFIIICGNAVTASDEIIPFVRSPIGMPVAEIAFAGPRRFLAGIGVLWAALFAPLIATRGSAGFILQGYEQ
jgi:hypothetical protein